MTTADAAVGREAPKGHPPALYILFFAELWERFSFYGMRALLVLYMTKALLFGDDPAYGVYGAYGALVYASPVLGGFLADKILGYRRSVVLGGILMALGHFAMAFEHLFYPALALLVVGNGFFKPNISSMVGKLYGEGDPRRDSGFTIFYMGINIGAWLAPLVCGAVGEYLGWHYGFGLAGVGMVAGLIVFVIGQHKLGDVGLPPGDTAERKVPLFAPLSTLVYVLAFGLVPLVAWLVENNESVETLLFVFAGIVVAGMIGSMFANGKVVTHRLIVLFVLMLFHVVFWAFFEQAGSSLTLFTDRNVNRNIFGWEAPASLFQSVNPGFIILLAIPFAQLWLALNRKGWNPAIPYKFGLGLAQLGLGFYLLVVGASMAGEDAKVAVLFLIGSYFFQTTGELSLSPVGLSAVTKLSPPKSVGFLMGGWFLTIAFAHHAAAQIAKLTSASNGDGHGGGEAVAEGVEAAVPSAAETLPLYSDVFFQIAIVAVAAGALIFITGPLLKKLMHGVE